MMEPGTYTLTLKVGDRTLTQMLVVERINGYGGDTSPFPLILSSHLSQQSR